MAAYGLSCDIWSAPNLVGVWAVKWQQNNKQAEKYSWTDWSLCFLLKSPNPNYFQKPGIIGNNKQDLARF